MTTLIIEIPDKVEKTLADLIAQLGGKVITTDSKSIQGQEKLTKKEKEILKGFEEAVEFVNQHQQGKVLN